MGKKKKTRQQKIIADLRRKLLLQKAQDDSLRQVYPERSRGAQDEPSLKHKVGSFPQIQVPSAQKKSPAGKSPFSLNSYLLSQKALQITGLAQGKSASISLESDYTYLAKDLKKSLFLIGLAILLQLVLYWLLR